MPIPFKPVADGTKKVTATTTSAATAFAAAPAAGDFNVRIHNAGSVLCAIKFGDSTVAADLTNDTPLPAAIVEVLTAPAGSTHFALIAASTTADVYVSNGDGI